MPLHGMEEIGKSDEKGVFEKNHSIFYCYSDLDHEGKYQHIEFYFSKPDYHPTKIEYYIPEIMRKYYINLGYVTLYSINAKEAFHDPRIQPTLWQHEWDNTIVW